ncbi:MAG: hypothetical protein KDA99_10955 [Planctomycetales bacterium]|nr:hypothetical protein [Planctomycetales bacterium]
MNPTSESQAQKSAAPFSNEGHTPGQRALMRAGIGIFVFGLIMALVGAVILAQEFQGLQEFGQGIHTFSKIVLIGGLLAFVLGFRKPRPARNPTAAQLDYQRSKDPESMDAILEPDATGLKGPGLHVSANSGRNPPAIRISALLVVLGSFYLMLALGYATGISLLTIPAIMMIWAGAPTIAIACIVYGRNRLRAFAIGFLTPTAIHTIAFSVTAFSPVLLRAFNGPMLGGGYGGFSVLYSTVVQSAPVLLVGGMLSFVSGMISVVVYEILRPKQR